MWFLSGVCYGFFVKDYNKLPNKGLRRNTPLHRMLWVSTSIVPTYALTPLHFKVCASEKFRNLVAKEKQNVEAQTTTKFIASIWARKWKLKWKLGYIVGS